MKKQIYVFGLFLILPIIAFNHFAQARVDMLPQLVVIEPRQRSGEVTILNVEEKPGLYRIAKLNYRQDEEGRYIKLDGPLSPEFDPDKDLRISPKQFELLSRGRQKVRISVRRPKDLPDGEYRFHLAATRYDTPQQEDAKFDDGSLSVTVGINLGVSIPVIIRHGEGSVSANITDVEYIAPTESDQYKFGKLRVTVNRKGNFSALGKLSVLHEGQEIGRVSNFNIFTDIDKRIAEIPLKADPRGLNAMQIIYKGLDEKTLSQHNFSL